MSSNAALIHTGEEEDDAEQHNGDPRPLPYAFEKELIDKSNKHIRYFDSFVPNGKVYPLGRKFYAQHDQRQPPQPQRFLRYTDVAQKERRTALGLPLLESQVYGWLPTWSGGDSHSDIATASIQINFMHAPKLRCRMTIHGERLIAERITERPPFHGLRFLLN